MKRQVQYPGVRKWSGDDLLGLQSECLSVLDGFLSQFGNCIVCGCGITEGGISSGLVCIGGMVMPFPATDVEVFPVYLVKDKEHIQREYADDVVRDIAVRYFAKAVQTKPEGECIEVTQEGASSFLDLIEAGWLDGIVSELKGLAKKDTTMETAISTLQQSGNTSTKRLDALEKRMPSFLDHTPTVSDFGYAIGTEVWTVDETGEKTFWKCHDNTEGAAVWRESGEGGGGGSHSGAVYLTGQTDITKASILINEGYLS